MIGLAAGSSIRGAKHLSEMGPIRITFYMIVGEQHKGIASTATSGGDPISDFLFGFLLLFFSFLVLWFNERRYLYNIYYQILGR